MKNMRFSALCVSVWWLASLFVMPAHTASAAATSATKNAKSAATANRTPAKKALPRPGIAKDPYIGAVAIDAATGRVLWEDKADARGYPASMLKLMDLFLILEKLSQKQLALGDAVPVSARAANTGGSQVWLKEKEVFTVEEMLYALMIQSANDVAVALAEKVAGSSEAFVELMNKRARELGMASTRFQSAHGLPPSVGQQHDVSTARDFAILCRALLARHPEALRYTSARERTFRPGAAQGAVIMRTHNHLLNSVEGCDGLKTGYFSQAGFSVAATASRGGRRVIAVVLGSADRKVRDARAAEILAKGFAALPTQTAAATGSGAGGLPVGGTAGPVSGAR